MRRTGETPVPGTISAGRNTKLGAEAPNEVRQIVKSDVQRNLGDGLSARDQAVGRMSETRAQQPLMRGNTGDALEGAQEVVAAKTRCACEIGDRRWLCAAGLQSTQQARDSTRIPRRVRRHLLGCASHPNDRPSQLECELFHRIGKAGGDPCPNGRCGRYSGARAHRCEDRKWRQPVGVQPRCGSHVVRHTLEQIIVKLEGKTAIPSPMLMRTLERVPSVGQQHGAR